MSAMTGSTSPKRAAPAMKIGGRVVQLSNVDKVLYPEADFTKGDVIDYYLRIAPVLLPHLKGRPLTLKRYPNGVTAPYFYEKRCPVHRPDWVSTMYSKTPADDSIINYCLVA